MRITLGLDSTSLTRRHPRLAVLASLFMAFGAPMGLYVAALALFPLNTPERLNAMAQQWLGYDLAGSPYRNLVYGAFLFLVAFVAVNFTAIFGGVSTWVERRIAGRMQSRIGPNRTSAAMYRPIGAPNAMNKLASTASLGWRRVSDVESSPRVILTGQPPGQRRRAMR